MNVMSPAKKRQMEAVLSARSRQDELRLVKHSSRVPCMVIHGKGDEFVPTANGHLLHELLGEEVSELMLLDNMGHGLEAANCPTIVEAMLRASCAFHKSFRDVLHRVSGNSHSRDNATSAAL